MQETIDSKENLGFPVDPEMEEVHRYARHNKKYLEKSESCYCFYCLKEPFDPKLITTWIDRGTTALCPYCGIDSIIPQAIQIKVQNVHSVEFQRRMYQHWFVNDEGTVYILKEGQIVEVPRND